MIRCTVRQLRALLNDLHPDAVLEVSSQFDPRSFDSTIAIGNARVAFARSASRRWRCPICGEQRIGFRGDRGSPIEYFCDIGHHWTEADTRGKR